MRGWQRFLAVTAGIGAVVFVATAMRAETASMPMDQGVDAWHYTRMAAGFPDTSVLSPFRNRPLVPTLVEVLPLPVTWGFVVVTSVLTGVAAAAMDRVLHRWFPPRVAWVGLAMLASVGTVNGLVAQPYYVDAAVLAAAAVTLWLLAEGRWAALIVVLPIAVVSHEMTLSLLIPVAVTAWRTKKMPYAVGMCAMAVAAWWLLHRSGTLVPVNRRADLRDPLHRAAIVRLNVERYGTYPGALWANLVLGVGVLGLLAPFGARRAPQIARDWCWVLLPAAVLTLSASDWARLFLPALPGLCVLSCAVLVPASDRTGDGPGSDRRSAEAERPPVADAGARIETADARRDPCDAGVSTWRKEGDSNPRDP